MFAVLKFFLAFCISFVLLSIPIQEKPIFYYLNQWAQPITSEIFSSSKSAIIEGVKETKVIGKKMFNNTKPKADEISVTSSSVNRSSKPKHIQKQADEEEINHEIEGIKHSDEFTDEEKNMLNNILKQARP